MREEESEEFLQVTTTKVLPKSQRRFDKDFWLENETITTTETVTAESVRQRVANGYANKGPASAAGK